MKKLLILIVALSFADVVTVFAAGPTKATPGTLGGALIVDSADRIVGTYLGEECGSRDFNGQRVDFCIYDERLVAGPSSITYYPSTDCSGPGYFYTWNFSGLTSRGPDNAMLLQAGKFQYAALPLVTIMIQSYRYLNECRVTETQPILAGEAREATFASLGFVPPFRIK
jgi:hypothetical protein